MLISRDKAIMGEYRNGRLAATHGGWTTAAVMVVAGSMGVWTTLSGS